VDECTTAPANASCWFIDGSCGDASGCLTKDLDGKCRKGCKRSSESETTSSCVLDGCIQYSSGACSTILGCVLAEGSCVSSFEGFGCVGVDSESECLSIANCDIFLGGVCGERVSYDKDCSLIGEEVCFKTSVCKWNPRVGCVEEEEEGKEAKGESFLTWSFFAFIGLKNFILFFFFTKVIRTLIFFFFILKF
jgi:hypothetical protein